MDGPFRVVVHFELGRVGFNSGIHRRPIFMVICEQYVSWNCIGILVNPEVTVYLGTSTTGVRADPKYYANRAGRIAASHFPVVIALGMRNNIISCSSRRSRRAGLYVANSYPLGLTGVSFDKVIPSIVTKRNESDQLPFS